MIEDRYVSVPMFLPFAILTLVSILQINSSRSMVNSRVVINRASNYEQNNQAYCSFIQPSIS